MLKAFQIVTNALLSGVLFFVFIIIAGCLVEYLRIKSRERKEFEEKIHRDPEPIRFYVNVKLSHPDNNWDKLWEGLILEAFNKTEFPNLEGSRHLKFSSRNSLGFCSNDLEIRVRFAIKRTKVLKNEKDLIDQKLNDLKVLPQNERD